MPQINPQDTYYAHSPKGFEVNIPGSQIPSLLKKDFIIVGRLEPGTEKGDEGTKEPFDEPLAKTQVHRSLFSGGWGGGEKGGLQTAEEKQEQSQQILED